MIAFEKEKQGKSKISQPEKELIFREDDKEMEI